METFTRGLSSDGSSATKRLSQRLAGEQFEPPPCYRLPPKTSEEFEAYELGMKITCGFEMLVAEARREEEEARPDAPNGRRRTTTACGVATIQGEFGGEWIL